MTIKHRFIGSLSLASAAMLSLTACGSSSSSTACAPFNSCKAVIDLVFDQSFTGADLNSLCDSWNGLTLGEQKTVAGQIADSAGELAGDGNLLLFQDPDAAAEGILNGFLGELDSRC
jgi:hypothetical protein